MSIENTPEHATSRRAFITGATAAGISAIVASHVPQAAAATVRKSQQPADPVKLVCVLRRRRDLSAAEFHGYWLNKHAPLATKLVEQLGAYRYVQSHTNDSNLNVLLRTSRGQLGEPFDGITEVWFHSEAALVEAMSTPAGLQANVRLVQDESNFIDLARSSYFLTKEYVFVGDDDTNEEPSDTSVEAAITSIRFSRTASGQRVLRVRLAVHERVTAVARLQRGGKTIAKTRARTLREGPQTLLVPVKALTGGGSALLALSLIDAAGNTKSLGRHVTIPVRRV